MASIRDVARRSGYSVGTVSNVLNGRIDLVSDEARDRVFAAMRELGYKPVASLNMPADRSLQRNIGLVRRSFALWSLEMNKYFIPVFDGIIGTATDSGWSVTMMTEEMLADVHVDVRHRIDGRCDGVIVVAPDTDSPLVDAMLDRGVPFVVVGGGNEDMRYSSVDVDGRRGARIAVEFLAAAGHRRIAHLRPGPELISTGEREEGFRQAVLECGLDPIECPVWIEQDWPHAGPAAVRWWVEQCAVDRPTALFCWNDRMARIVLDAFRVAHIRVPQDVSIVGFDGTPDALEANPRIATVRQPLYTIGVRSFQILVEKLRHPKASNEKVAFLPDLVAGASVAGPAAHDLNEQVTLTEGANNASPESSVYAH